MTESFRTWRTPTLIILAGCLISLIGFGTRAGFGLWLDPMSKAMGWERDVFALAMAIQNLVWGAAQPFAGALADKYGNARVLAVGALLYAGGTALMALSTSPAEIHLSAGLMIGLGLAGASFSVVLAAFGRMMPPEKRSMALGIGTAAGSLGQFLIVPISGQLIAWLDWQAALLVMSAFPLIIVPASMVLAGKSEVPAGGVSQSLTGAIREASRHSGYWLLVSGFFVCGFHVAFIQVHLPPYISEDLALPPEIAAWSLALVGLLNVFGSFAAGVMGGKYSKKYLLSSLYFARSAVITAYVLVPPSIESTLVFSAAMGLLWLSTVPLTSGLVAQIFGPQYMGMLFGFVFFSHQVGAFLGAWLGGELYVMTGSYEIVWWIAVALGILAALVHFPINDKQVERLAEAT